MATVLRTGETLLAAEITIERPDGSRVPYDRASVWGNPVASKFWDRKVNAQGQLLGEQSWPCQKPPWGQFSAAS